MEKFEQDETSFRSRCNTWPRNERSDEEDKRKKSFFLGRRNIYGEYSYSDLITKAITSSPEKKLSLSEIYDWMIVNVPVLKNRTEGMASWKNSIRHNLSLHSKFVRIQNSSSGKSSYWTVDPDAKPGKSGRRRSGSMESNKLQAKRQKARLVQIAARNTQDIVQSQVVNVSEPYVLPGFQMSPCFRQRTWSNESSGSRLSAIPSEEVLTNIPNERMDISMECYQPYQNYNQFRSRSYSSGSSGGKISPDSAENLRRYCVKLPSVPATSYVENKGNYDPFFKEQNLDMLSNNLQYSMTIETPQNHNYAENNTNFYKQIDTGYQVAMNIINSEVRPQSLDLNNRSLEDVDNIQIDLLKSPIQCNVDEVINFELKMGSNFDFN